MSLQERRLLVCRKEIEGAFIMLAFVKIEQIYNSEYFNAIN